MDTKLKNTNNIKKIIAFVFAVLFTFISAFSVCCSIRDSFYYNRNEATGDYPGFENTNVFRNELNHFEDKAFSDGELLSCNNLDDYYKTSQGKELLKTVDHGQFSVNISKPGITKGQHWHNSKWEFFIVVAGHGLIQERKIGSDEVIEFEVSGDKIQAVHMLPGYTHNIINLSESENLVTVMWANELFDPDYPDTFFEIV